MPPPVVASDPPVIQWNATVRRSGVIRLFVKSSMRGSGWAGIVDQAIRELNTALSNKGFIMEVKKTASESEAEATIETTPGSALHGQTLLDRQGTDNVQKATIMVPATPRVSKRDPKAREAGAGVRLYIVVHELVHTLGLSNAAHSRDDVFTREPTLLVPGIVLPGGRGVTEDKIQAFDGTVIPPIVLGAATLANLKKAWPDHLRIPI
jgi:hypothetical protein